VGPLVIGAGTEIGPYVAIYPGTSIGNNVVIQPFTEIRNSIIEDSVHIGPQSLIDSAILAGGGNFGARFHAQSGPVVVRAAEEYRTQGGAVVAEYVEAGHSVSLNSGVLVGKGARIANGRSVQENIPEDALVM
jgi:glucose-1-phosphate thymidylyltransferase